MVSGSESVTQDDLRQPIFRYALHKFVSPPPTRRNGFAGRNFIIYCLRKWLDRKNLSNILRTIIGFESEVINNLKVESVTQGYFYLYCLFFMQREITNLNLVVDIIARYFSKKSYVCEFLFLSNLLQTKNILYQIPH